jgi:O-antigen ligase
VISLALLVWVRRHTTPNWKSAAWLAAVALTVLVVFAATNWSLLAPRLGLVSQGVEIRSVEERSSLTAAARALIRERPLLGVGLGNFSVALYRIPLGISTWKTYQPVHNVVLLSAAELGLLGGALWLGLMLAPWAGLWIKRRQVRMTPWLAGLSGALAALALVSWVDAYVWSAHQGRLLQWLIWGLWAAEWRLASDSYIAREVMR